MKKFDEQEIYERLYLKMSPYKHNLPFIDFLNDIVARRNKSFNKEGAYNDLEKLFDAFMKYRNEAQKYEELMEKYGIPNVEYLEQCIKRSDECGELEEEIGCPLKVRCKLRTSMIIWDDRGNAINIYSLNETEMVGHTIGYGYTNGYAYRDYKRTWWLKPDRSE